MVVTGTNDKCTVRRTSVINLEQLRTHHHSQTTPRTHTADGIYTRHWFRSAPHTVTHTLRRNQI